MWGKTASAAGTIWFHQFATSEASGRLWGEVRSGCEIQLLGLAEATIAHSQWLPGAGRAFAKSLWGQWDVAGPRSLSRGNQVPRRDSVNRVVNELSERIVLAWRGLGRDQEVLGKGPLAIDPMFFA